MIDTYHDADLISVTFDMLEGLLLTSIVMNEDKYQIDFVTHNGLQFTMYHEQDCCEQVTVEDICGDLGDLTNSPIIKASEDSNEGENDDNDHYTWTFYNLSTPYAGWGHLTVIIVSL